ncbi:hypothetical protein HDV02_000366 [Globomyces sp. JEL0801]|nr:hypothetical protein HDV02_000366 [Globomyces sp. JEL0801]
MNFQSIVLLSMAVLAQVQVQVQVQNREVHLQRRQGPRGQSLTDDSNSLPVAQSEPDILNQ